jgi:hypothetical protein
LSSCCFAVTLSSRRCGLPTQNLTAYADQLAAAIGEYEGTFVGETGALVRRRSRRAAQRRSAWSTDAPRAPSLRPRVCARASLQP